MKWKVLAKSDCEQAVATLPQSFSQEELDQEYRQLRDDLEAVALTLYASVPELKEYSFDLAFAVPMYDLLNQKYGMNERLASNDGVWRYLSIKVIPDVVLHRWGYRDARFWKEPRRIWLKALWWYVYLSWQGDAESTRRILAGNTTDILVQIVERPGPQGYRVETCRQIMKQLASIPAEQKRADIFRKMMVLNTARLKVVEPGLFKEGEPEYARQLLAYFNAN